MTDTSRYPVATRTLILFLAFFNGALFFVHINILAPSNSSRRGSISTLMFFYLFIIGISYFITFREIEWRYDEPIEGQNNGQDMQDLRTARTVMQLISHLFLYSCICVIINERVGALGLPQRFRGKVAKWLQTFLVAAMFLVGLTHVSLTAWSYRAFYGGQISWEDYQSRLVVAREIDYAWVLLTGLFPIFLVIRTVNHMINLRRLELGDSVCERLLYLISPLLLLRAVILGIVNFILPAFLGISIGEITGSRLTLAALNDPNLSDSNLEYLEIVTQLSVNTELFMIIVALVWLLSKYAWYHWELKAVRPKPVVAKPKKQQKENKAEETKEVPVAVV